MSKMEIPLNYFRKGFFGLMLLLESTLMVLFLVLPFYHLSSLDALPGYRTLFGWLLTVTSFVVAVCSLFVFLSSFSYRRRVSLQNFFGSEKLVKIICYIAFFALFVEIVLIGITQIYFTLFSVHLTPMVMIIIALSLFLPFFLYFIANFSKKEGTVYALSSEAPLRLQLTAFWLIFITAFIQIFATQWEFVVIGLLLLLAAYLFFFLYRSAVVVTPSILLIHFVFSLVLGILSLVKQDEIIQELLEANETISPLQATLMSVFLFLIPGVISFLLAQSFFRKWVLSWIRCARPEPELEINLEMAE